MRLRLQRFIRLWVAYRAARRDPILAAYLAWRNHRP